eukprot:1380273-Amphidinium_carterae.3
MCNGATTLFSTKPGNWNKVPIQTKCLLTSQLDQHPTQNNEFDPKQVKLAQTANSSANLGSANALFYRDRWCE